VPKAVTRPNLILRICQHKAGRALVRELTTIRWRSLDAAILISATYGACGPLLERGQIRYPAPAVDQPASCRAAECHKQDMLPPSTRSLLHSMHKKRP
jgi:hypothetical protein